MIDKIKLGLIGCGVLTIMAGAVHAFSETDAKHIGAISKKMAETTTEIALTDIKYSNLAAELAVINDKMELVQNHRNVQKALLESYKKEIDLIINPDKEVF